MPLPVWSAAWRMFYDFLLCVALMMVVTLVYQQGILRLIYGSEHLRELADRGALIGDPLLSTLLVFALFGFFAKFWTHNGQTLGMQVWGLRVQNRDGSAISLLQALLRFMIAIASWLCLGLGFLWMLWDKDKRTWHDRYSESQVVGCRRTLTRSERNRSAERAVLAFVAPAAAPARRDRKHKGHPWVAFSYPACRACQPARRSSQTPASAQIEAGITTASSGGKSNTRLEGPSRSWAMRKTKPTSTPVKIRWPRVTERNGPKMKEIAISTSAAVTSGCRTLVQNASQ